MSTTTFGILLLISGLASVGCAIVNHRLSRRIILLREGQARWRDIAIHHAETVEEARRARHKARQRAALQARLLADRDEQVNALLVSIWGAPPLEGRSMRDVISHIEGLRKLAQDREQASQRLMELVCRHNEETQRLRDEVALARASLAEMQEEYARQGAELKSQSELLHTLLMNGWALVLIKKDFSAFEVVGLESFAHIGAGSTPEEAVDDALKRNGLKPIIREASAS